jgi:superkiller protein 3
LQNYDEAITLSQNSDVEDIYYFKGNCLLELDRYDEAIA